MHLILNGLDVECVIGERVDERMRLQRLVLDIELEVDDRVVKTDALEDTVDYAALSVRVRSALQKAKCQMIERAAYVAYEACIVDERVKWVRVKVTKTGAIAHLASCTAIYEGTRVSEV